MGNCSFASASSDSTRIQLFRRTLRAGTCDEIVRILSSIDRATAHRMMRDAEGKMIVSKLFSRSRPDVRLEHVEYVCGLMSDYEYTSQSNATPGDTFLHMACSSSRGCQSDIIQYLLERDPAAARYERSAELPYHRLLMRCNETHLPILEKLWRLSDLSIDTDPRCLNLIVSNETCPQSLREKFVNAFIERGTTQLVLANNFIGTESVRKVLAPLLPYLTNFNCTILNWTRDGWQTMWSMLSNNNSLKVLNLHVPEAFRNECTAANVFALIRHNTTIDRLTVWSGNEVVTPDLPDALKANKSLKSIRLCNSTRTRTRSHQEGATNHSAAAPFLTLLSDALADNVTLKQLCVWNWPNLDDYWKAQDLIELNRSGRAMVRDHANLSLECVVEVLSNVPPNNVTILYKLLQECPGIWS